VVWSVSGAVRDLPRLREISAVLIRHGLGDVVRRAGVASLLERAGQVLHWGEAAGIPHLEPQQRVRLACEELGPTFVKLGQMLPPISTWNACCARPASPPACSSPTPSCASSTYRAARQAAGSLFHCALGGVAGRRAAGLPTPAARAGIEFEGSRS